MCSEFWKGQRAMSLLTSILLLLVNGHLQLRTTLGSEFPERECCDPVYPIPSPGSGNSLNAGHGAIAPAAFPEYVPPSPASGITTEIPGLQTKTAADPMDCMQAQNSCKDNTACSPILEIVPRVCGPEKVACTTLTVTKCQAALRTLRAFPYFFPTCLCRERGSDPACNAFQDYLFDHPCSLVKEKEKDPYPVDALPTCDYAMDVCRQQPKCHQLYRDFKTHCPVSGGGVCKMDDGELCHNAWTKLRLSPMFGCICPNGVPRCERLFKEVNYNPCVAYDAVLDLNGTTSALYSLDNGSGITGLLHYSYNPTTLFPKPGTHFHFHRHFQQNAPPPQAPPQTHHHSSHHHHKGHHQSSHHIVQSARTESVFFVEDVSLSTPVSHHASYPPPGSFATSQIGSIGSIAVQVIPASNPPEFGLDSQLETPLLGSASNHAEQENKPPPFMPPVHSPPPPHKSTMSRTDAEQSSRPQPRHSGGIATISSVRNAGGSERHQVKIPLQTTCYSALQNCRKSPACSKLLQSILSWCDPSRCRQETCMRALREFYRTVQENHAIEVAFCLCRKSEHRIDQECLHAQGQLHPVCAQRGDLGISPPSCHSLAASCREEPECKSRLEVYEKACAVDSVTRKCAGPTSHCRNATVGILGTVLKKSCACNGTDYNQLYDCLGWQRILWVNPCVLESQKDYHRVRSTSTLTSLLPGRGQGEGPSIVLSQVPTEPETFSHEGVLIGTDVLSTTLGHPVPVAIDSRSEVTSEKATTTGRNVAAFHPNPSKIPTSRHPTPNVVNSNIVVQGPEIILYPTATPAHKHPVIVVGADDEVTTRQTTVTKSSTSTTPPQKYCIVQRPNQNPQQILEGMSRRFYRDDRPTCSEYCTCSSTLSSASCTVIACLDSTSRQSLSCSQKQRDNKTIMYSHGAPSYQANRGKCVCYAGSFVCVKPLQEKYNLNRGVFLFIGFSKVDQEVMRSHTTVEASKVIETLRNLINPDLQHQFANTADEGSGIEALREVNTSECHLGLFKEEDENLIINATIADEEFGNFTLRQPNDELFIEEKRKCGPVLQVLSNLINEKKSVIQSHPLLSILKLAEVVENKIPNTRSRSEVNLPHSHFVTILTSLLLLLLINQLAPINHHNFLYLFNL